MTEGVNEDDQGRKEMWGTGSNIYFETTVLKSMGAKIERVCRIYKLGKSPRNCEKGAIWRL